MTGPEQQRPPSLDDVMGIVERRRRRRERVRGVAAPALSVAAVGVAGLVVVAVQAGPDTPVVDPAAPGVSALPAPVPEPGLTVPFEIDTGYLTPTYLADLAAALAGSGDPELTRRLDDADELARVWGVPPYPAAKALVQKAELSGVPIDPADPGGYDILAQRFADAGYTAADGRALAQTWGTDPRTAEAMGGLLLAAGLMTD